MCRVREAKIPGDPSGERQEGALGARTADQVVVVERQLGGVLASRGRPASLPNPSPPPRRPRSHGNREGLETPSGRLRGAQCILKWAFSGNQEVWAWFPALQALRTGWCLSILGFCGLFDKIPGSDALRNFSILGGSQPRRREGYEGRSSPSPTVSARVSGARSEPAGRLAPLSGCPPPRERRGLAK